jgi:uncharacterized RDD family membrane protein YckC
MVLKEINHEEAGAQPASVVSSALKAPALETRLAAPIDRLAATVADFILFAPLMTLAMSPFKRQAVEAQLSGNDEAWMMACLSGGLTAALVLVIYQTVCLMKWRATPGKMIFGLRVEALWPEQRALNPMSAFLRSIVFCLEIVMLGLPWLAILSNERRRPFHDRIADTIVISKRARKVGPPVLSEMAFSSGLLAAVLTCVALVTTFKLTQMGFGGHSAAADLESSGDLCAAVGEAERNWIPGTGEERPSRIGVALTLYHADAINQDCLKQEADYAMWNGDQKDLAYLARGLSETADDELAQSYLDKACETTTPGDACRALTLLREPELPEDEIEAKTAQVDHENQVHEIVESLGPKTAPFLKVLAIRELSTERNDSRALQFIDQFPPQKELSYFLATERTKALWNLDRQSEARLSLQSSISGFDADQRIAVSRWFCQNETSAIGCAAAQRPACDWLANAVAQDEDLLKNADITLTYLRGETCSERLGEKQLASLKPKVGDEAARTYVEALEHLAKGQKDKGREVLQKLAADTEKSGSFFIEANARLADLAGSPTDLVKVRDAWTKTDPSEEGWAFLGRHLMDRYNQLRAWDETLEVGFKLGQNEAIDRSAARALVVAAYRAGHSRMAYGYLEAFAKTTRAAVAADERPRDRMPANSGKAPSSDGFEEIARELLNGTSLTPKLRSREVRSPFGGSK